MDTLLIKNVNIVGENEILSDSDIRVREGKIAEIGRGLFPEPGETVADFGGCYAAPGFIDIHVHGGNGSDFMDATEADFENIASFHAAHGTTSMLATTLAAADEELLDALHCFNGYVERPHAGANLLGLHLEGPYFSYEQRGAQDPKYLLCPTKSHYRKFMDASPHIKRWSAAPELEGTAEFAAECRNRGILLSAAHSSCTAAEALEALREGFGLITHFYSGMNGVIRRNSFRIAGLVEAGYLYDGFRVELIADGCHLPAELLSLVLKVKGEKNIALITDCTSAAGLTSPPYIIGSRKNGQPVVVEQGVAFLPDRNSFAGSVATTDRLLETMLALTPATIPQAVRMLSLTPAEILGIADSKGRIAAGWDADLVLFDRMEGKIQIRSVYVGGKPV